VARFDDQAMQSATLAVYGELLWGSGGQ
jgi:hypothetical protein